MRKFQRSSVFSIIASTLFVVIESCMGIAYAQSVEETLPFVGTPQSEWIAVLGKDGIELRKANLRKTPHSLYISTEAHDFGEQTLISGVAVLDDGRVISSSFHAAGKDELPVGSAEVAQAKASDLEQRVEFSKKRIVELEESLRELNLKLRKESGLDEVDQVYEKVAAIERKIQEIKGN